MKNKLLIVLSFVMMLTTLMTLLPACTTIVAASSYVAVVPSILHSGRSEAISLSLFSGNSLVNDKVEVTLLKEGRSLTSTKQTLKGSGTVVLNIPDVADGAYTLEVKGGAFQRYGNCPDPKELRGVRRNGQTYLQTRSDYACPRADSRS